MRSAETVEAGPPQGDDETLTMDYLYEDQANGRDGIAALSHQEQSGTPSCSAPARTMAKMGVRDAPCGDRGGTYPMSAPRSIQSGLSTSRAQRLRWPCRLRHETFEGPGIVGGEYLP